MSLTHGTKFPSARAITNASQAPQTPHRHISGGGYYIMVAGRRDAGRGRAREFMTQDRPFYREQKIEQSARFY
jgi:hypothetical protein